MRPAERELETCGERRVRDLRRERVSRPAERERERVRDLWRES